MTKQEWIAKVNAAIARSEWAVEMGAKADLVDGKVFYSDRPKRYHSDRKITFAEVCRYLHGLDIRALKAARA